MSSPPPAPPVRFREHGLDALRVFAFTLLILYHSGMGFVSWPWHVKNPQHSEALEWVMLFMNRWRLPLLFFISGAGVSFSLRRRTMSQFAGERVQRLLLPLVVGMFVVVPPQIYFERLAQGRVFSSYWDFYRTVFEFQPYPQGSFSWHHLWFVMYVLVYALAGIPLFRFLRSPRGVAWVGRFADALERWPLAVYFVNVPNLVVGMVLGPHWPTTNNLIADWANLLGSALTFYWGFVFASDRRLLDLVTRRRREFLVVGIVVAAIFFTLRATQTGGEWSLLVQLTVGSVVSGLFGMAWIFTLIGYARTWIVRSTPLLSYATEAVYPFYIFHQTITVALVFSLRDWPVAVGPKLAVVAMGTFLGSWLLFEAVRRVNPLRPLFGLKPN